jgi:hypothetical protein
MVINMRRLVFSGGDELSVLRVEDQDGAWGFADKLFGNAAVEDVGEAGAAVGGKNDEVGALFAGGFSDGFLGETNSDYGAAEAGKSEMLLFAQPGDPFLSGFAESVHACSGRIGGADVRVGNGCCDDVQKRYRGGKALSEADGIAETEVRVLGEIDRHEDFADAKRGRGFGCQWMWRC